MTKELAYCLIDMNNNSEIILNKQQSFNVISGAGFVRMAKILKEKKIESIRTSDLEEIGRAIVKETIESAKSGG